MYIKPTIEVIEFTDEEVVMNLVASSNQSFPQPGWQDGQDSEFIS